MSLKTIRSSISNAIMATCMGYAVSLGISVDDAIAAIENPHSTNWGAVGTGLVQTAFRLNPDITPYIEGPVKDFVMGVRDAILDNKDNDNFSKIQPQYY